MSFGDLHGIPTSAQRALLQHGWSTVRAVALLRLGQGDTHLQ